MLKEKVLIIIKTYQTLSEKYNELAGFTHEMPNTYEYSRKGERCTVLGRKGKNKYYRSNV